MAKSKARQLRKPSKTLQKLTQITSTILINAGNGRLKTDKISLRSFLLLSGYISLFGRICSPTVAEYLGL